MIFVTLICDKESFSISICFLENLFQISSYFGLHLLMQLLLVCQKDTAVTHKYDYWRGISIVKDPIIFLPFILISTPNSLSISSFLLAFLSAMTGTNEIGATRTNKAVKARGPKLFILITTLSLQKRNAYCLLRMTPR